MSMHTLLSGVTEQLNIIGKRTAELATKEDQMWEDVKIEKRLILIEEYKHFKLLLDNFHKVGNELIQFQSNRLERHVEILKNNKNNSAPEVKNVSFTKKSAMQVK